MSSQMIAPAQYDVIGLGFGPANVAIAGAIVDKWANPEPSQVRFPVPITSPFPTHNIIIGSLPYNVRHRTVRLVSCSSPGGLVH